MHIADNTDDSPSAILCHHLPDWVLARPQSASQGFVHHDYGFSRRSIALREFSPRLQCDTQRLEISIRHHANKRLGMMVLVVYLSFGPDLNPTPQAVLPV